MEEISWLDKVTYEEVLRRVNEDRQILNSILHLARWPSGSGAGLVINRSRVRIPAAPLSSATLGKLFTHMPLSPSSIIWYQPRGSDALRLRRYS